MAEATKSHPKPVHQSILRAELPAWIGIGATLLLYVVGRHWLDDLGNPLKFAVLFFGVCATILWLSFNVVKHAECLAHKLGEPYGTLILTFAVITIEVAMITAMMLTGDNNPALARDTMFSVVMIVLNGVMGLTLVLGGIKHREQAHNLKGTASYLSMIVPLSLLALVLPHFTTSQPGNQPSRLISVFLIVVALVLYSLFILVQTRLHTAYFQEPEEAVECSRDRGHEHLEIRSIFFHSLFLFLSLAPVVLLAEKMAKLVEHGLEVVHAPDALAGFVVASMVLAPEALGAIRAALQNRLQRTVNIGLGSALSTICLTIPAALSVALITGKTVQLGLEPVEILLLCTTLLLSAITFAAGRTTILQGAVHLLVFFAYLVLMFD